MLFLYEMKLDYLFCCIVVVLLLLTLLKYSLYIIEQFPLCYHLQLVRLQHHNYAVTRLYFYFL